MLGYLFLHHPADMHSLLLNKFQKLYHMADLENDKEGEKLVGKYIPIDPDPLKSLLLLSNQPLPSISVAAFLSRFLYRGK